MPYYLIDDVAFIEAYLYIFEPCLKTVVHICKESGLKEAEDSRIRGRGSRCKDKLLSKATYQLSVSWELLWATSNWD